MLDIFSERAAEATHKPVKSVKAFIKKSWTRKDFWVSSDEALKYGFIDEID
jgi:ATP-dependent protease ClpP protease subunit